MLGTEAIAVLDFGTTSLATGPVLPSVPIRLAVVLVLQGVLRRCRWSAQTDRRRAAGRASRSPRNWPLNSRATDGAPLLTHLLTALPY